MIVYRARHLFNQLCLFAAVTSVGSAGASAAGTQPGTTGVVADVDAPENAESGRSLQYMNDTLRPNIHVGVHFPDFAEEYALPVNCNTLTGENLHRQVHFCCIPLYFKTRVYETNYSNIEKVLLMKTNFQETMRLVLRNAFKHDDPELTAQIMGLYQQCPNLFNKVLSRADRNELEAKQEAVVEESEVDVDQSASATHMSPLAINRISTKQVTQAHSANEGRRLPLRTTDTTSTWRHLIRSAYRHEYGKAPYFPSVFDNRAIQWCRKFGFTDR
ncbi:hypothetical protein C8A05DRAFT_20664, partial [Staphylotrichum tortipilum]